MNSFLFHSKIKPSVNVGVSACLLGYRVRYDGKTKSITQLLEDAIIETLWHPICPEITLGVPRPPVQLVQTNQHIQAVGVKNATLNVTDTLSRNSHHILHSEASQSRIKTRSTNEDLKRIALGESQAKKLALKEEVDIWLLKARSPSCGNQSTPLYNAHGEQMTQTDGLFVQACRSLSPLCGIFDESAFLCPQKQQVFYLTALITKDIKQASDATMGRLIRHYKEWKLLPEVFTQIAKEQVCRELHSAIGKSDSEILNHYIDSISGR